MCFKSIFLFIYCISILLSPTSSSRRHSGEVHHIPTDDRNSELAQKVVKIISEAATNNKKGERDLYVYKPDHGSQDSEEHRPVYSQGGEESYVSEEGIFTTESPPEMRAEEYEDEDAANDRAVIVEQMFQQALSTFSPTTTEPPTEKPQHRLRASEIDIDDIAEKVKQKLEKYFLSTTTAVGVNFNSYKKQGYKSAKRPMQNIRQQPTTNNNNGDYKYDGDTSETTNNNNNNNNNNNENDNLYGQESFISNNYKTVSYSSINTKDTKNEQESIDNNNNNGQNYEYSSLREAPHGHNNNKRQNTNANNNIGRQQTYNNNENIQETYVNNKNRPETHGYINNNDQQQYTTNDNGQNSYGNNENAQETFINNNNKQVNANNNNIRQVIDINEAQQTNIHKKFKTIHKNKQQSNIRTDLQINEQKTISNNPEMNREIIEDNPMNNPISQQSEVLSSPRIKRLKYRPHQQPDIAVTETIATQSKKAPNAAIPEGMMVEVPMAGGKHDFYDDYKIPERDDNMFASAEKTTKNIAQKIKKKTTSSFRVETENLNFDSNEKTVKAKTFKVTGLHKRSTYTVLRPEFPEKMPLIAVPYNFSEPIPENDRIEENKTFKIPPAKVNGKLSLI